VHDHDDFDFEHSPGIPAPLPPGEHVIWQGSPDRWEVAKSAFHIRKLALYFALIFIIQAVSIVQSGTQPLLASLTLTIILSLVGLAIPAVLAYLTSRVTIYTVTNERILIRFGIALQMTINLPFTQISAADVRVDKNGFGDIPLVLKDTERVNYFVLWPHVRPWNVSKTARVSVRVFPVRPPMRSSCNRNSHETRRERNSAHVVSYRCCAGPAYDSVFQFHAQAG